MAVIPFLNDVSLGQWLVGLSIMAGSWCCYEVAYRLYLGPLSKFPGPKLAALTGWYETYFDCFKRGRYWVEIEKMHEKYGPIVRISPWEIHVNDPDWNEPYKMSSKVNKYHWYYRFVGTSEAGFGTSDHELHRRRRKAQQNYFTQEAVARFDPKLQAMTSKLMKRLEEARGTGRPVNLSNAFRSLATDVVTEFSFHKSHNLLDHPDFAADFQKTFRNYPEIGIWHRHFGVILDLMELMPLWLAKRLTPGTVSVIIFFDYISAMTKEMVANYYDNVSEKRGGKFNVIHQMLDSPELSDKDKRTERLELEVETFVAAGTETTGNTLTATTFYLLSNPMMAKRMREEILEAREKSSTPLKYQDLQQLRYLTAVIQEGLRISTSVAGRLPRVNTRDAITYKSYTIPAGTPISTTQKPTHDNPTIFANPRSFQPERWLVAPEERKRLEKYLQPFGKGSRTCIGLHLANSEVYLTLAELFSRFEMEIFDTDEEDIEQYHDFFSPYPVSERGLRVIVS